jgi:hypothetical protein
MREAIYNNLSGPVRSALHRQAAIVVRADGGSPVEIAEHLIRSEHKGDGQAITVLREAAAHVAGNAPGTAADLILRALDVLDEQDPVRPEVTADVVQRWAPAAGWSRQASSARPHCGSA